MALGDGQTLHGRKLVTACCVSDLQGADAFITADHLQRHHRQMGLNSTNTFKHLTVRKSILLWIQHLDQSDLRSGDSRCPPREGGIVFLAILHCLSMFLPCLVFLCLCDICSQRTETNISFLSYSSTAERASYLPVGVLYSGDVGVSEGAFNKPKDQGALPHPACSKHHHPVVVTLLRHSGSWGPTAALEK